jgi:integration host factor subunit beta
MATTTKKELIDRITTSTGAKRAAVRDIVQEFLDQVIEELERGNRLEFRNFGVFEVRVRAARIAQNPKTLERVPVPARRTVKFKAGRDLRDRAEALATTLKLVDGHAPEVEIKVKPNKRGASAAV